jgi:hypothetical protein
MSLQIDDLAAATFTPYNEDGSVAYDLIEAHAADLYKHGVPYAFSEFLLGWILIAQSLRL